MCLHLVLATYIYLDVHIEVTFLFYFIFSMQLRISIYQVLTRDYSHSLLTLSIGKMFSENLGYFSVSKL